MPVGGPFLRVGMGVLQLPLTTNVTLCSLLHGLLNQAFLVSVQQEETIAPICRECGLSSWSVPEELLPDRGTDPGCV